MSAGGGSVAVGSRPVSSRSALRSGLRSAASRRSSYSGAVAQVAWQDQVEDSRGDVGGAEAEAGGVVGFVGGGALGPEIGKIDVGSGGEVDAAGDNGREGLQEGLVRRLLDDPSILERKESIKASERSIQNMSDGADAQDEESGEDEGWGSSTTGSQRRADTAPVEDISQWLSEEEQHLIDFFAFEDETRPGTVGVRGEGEGRGWQREKVHMPRGLTAVVSPRRAVTQRGSGPLVRLEGWVPIGYRGQSESLVLEDGEEGACGADAVERTSSGTSIHFAEESRAHVGAHARLGRILGNKEPRQGMLPVVQEDGFGVGGGGEGGGRDQPVLHCLLEARGVVTLYVTFLPAKMSALGQGERHCGAIKLLVAPHAPPPAALQAESPRAPADALQPAASAGEHAVFSISPASGAGGLLLAAGRLPRVCVCVCLCVCDLPRYDAPHCPPGSHSLHVDPAAAIPWEGFGCYVAQHARAATRIQSRHRGATARDRVRALRRALDHKWIGLTVVLPLPPALRSLSSRAEHAISQLTLASALSSHGCRQMLPALLG